MRAKEVIGDVVVVAALIVIALMIGIALTHVDLSGGHSDTPDMSMFGDTSTTPTGGEIHEYICANRPLSGVDYSDC